MVKCLEQALRFANMVTVLVAWRTWKAHVFPQHALKYFQPWAFTVLHATLNKHENNDIPWLLLTVLGKPTNGRNELSVEINQLLSAQDTKTKEKDLMMSLSGSRCAHTVPKCVFRSHRLQVAENQTEVLI